MSTVTHHIWWEILCDYTSIALLATLSATTGFVLYSNHEALKYNSQKRLNTGSKWVKFLQDYTFVLKHKMGVENKAANALNRRVIILVVMSVEVTRFEALREEYESCPDFKRYISCYRTVWLERYMVFLLHDGYLFRSHKLCILCTSLRDFISWSCMLEIWLDTSARTRRLRLLSIDSIGRAWRKKLLRLLVTVTLDIWTSNKNKLPILTLSSHSITLARCELRFYTRITKNTKKDMNLS